MQTPPTEMNRLAHETSPYLLQHADNPVDWYPWGEEAFAAAAESGKPVLVSIGYSSCHWCHVMEHECFEDAEIAALMNELFICIKVDREERPDVDEIYMTAVQMMGLSTGWPRNVFLTAQGRPFYGGTYFPPVRAYRQPGWPDVLRDIARTYRDEGEKIAGQAQQIADALERISRSTASTGLPGDEIAGKVVEESISSFDAENGGFGGAPKFPPHQGIRFLLRAYHRTGNTQALEMADATLRKMAAGGIRDHLGGGFHRYSVDEKWLVPHFEKMLYDNAQLAREYTEAFQVTGDPFHADIAREILDYVLREMTEESGGFRSATDADSEGREGVFFLWKRSEIEALLGADAEWFCRAYGVTREGNFRDPHHPVAEGEEGLTVLHEAVSVADLARDSGRGEAEIAETLARGRSVLFEARKSRIYPGLDDKVLAAWNGLMISSMACAGRVLDEPRYVEAAERAAHFVLTEMRTESGRLLRTHRGGDSRIPAFLKDHAFFAEALLDLYETTFDPRWLIEAKRTADDMERLFGDAEAGGWFHTASDGETLIARMKSPSDGAVPGGNGAAVRVFLRLSVLLGDSSYAERADAAFRLFRESIERRPGGTMGLVLGLDMRLHEDGEIAVVGDLDAPETRALLRTIHHRFLPGTALAHCAPGGEGESEGLTPLLTGKTLVEGKPAAFVCRNYACRVPATTVEDLEEQLAGI